MWWELERGRWKSLRGRGGGEAVERGSEAVYWVFSSCRTLLQRQSCIRICGKIKKGLEIIQTCKAGWEIISFLVLCTPSTGTANAAGTVGHSTITLGQTALPRAVPTSAPSLRDSLIWQMGLATLLCCHLPPTLPFPDLCTATRLPDPVGC